MTTFPTDAERAAAERSLHNVLSPNDATYAADNVLDALASLVADRERAAAARALREAAGAWQTGEWTALTDSARKGGPSGVIGSAQAVTGWLRDRADELEAGER